MIPEYGSFALSTAVTLAILLSSYPILGLLINKPTMIKSASWLSGALFFVLLFAFSCLIYILVTNDFTVIYVAQNSNSVLPFYYRIAAAWGAYEGSLLLWSLMLSGWSCAILFVKNRIPETMRALSLSILGMINGGVLLFILALANPFQRSLPYYPIDGSDLNPLLEDVHLILHIPILYMGYVGFAVVFALTCTILIQERFNKIWLKWLHPWVLCAWVFLSMGIFSATTWSYIELNWAEWWFWDPVENVSLLPWLTGTALLHSTANASRNGRFKRWSIILSLVTFFLCLLATFLTRSGVLASIHFLSASPIMGGFLMSYLFLVFVTTVTLYFFRHQKLYASQVQKEKLFSRTFLLLSNNIILVIAAVGVFIGTFVPLFQEQINEREIAINTHLFNMIFFILTIPLALQLGITLFVRWRKPSQRLPVTYFRFGFSIILTVILTLSFMFAMSFSQIYTGIGVFLACWIIVHSICEVCRKIYDNNPKIMIGIQQLTPKYLGMFLAHLGLAFLIFGIAITMNHSVHKTVVMQPSEQIRFADYDITFSAIEKFKGPSYISDIGLFYVTPAGKNTSPRLLLPEFRQYIANKITINEAAIDMTVTRDIYIVMYEQLEELSWVVSLYYKPFQMWIWIGMICMIFGALLSLLQPVIRLIHPMNFAIRRLKNQ